MPVSTPLDILLDSAKAAHDGEARRLAEDLNNARAAEERLQLLHEFRHEYEGRFRDRAAVGFSADAWRNYRIFLAQLDAAIEAQRGELAARRQMAETRRGTYAVAGQRLRTYETLAERRAAEVRLAADRREQKITDEFAMQRSRQQPRVAE